MYLCVWNASFAPLFIVHSLSIFMYSWRAYFFFLALNYALTFEFINAYSFLIIYAHYYFIFESAIFRTLSHFRAIWFSIPNITLLSNAALSISLTLSNCYMIESLHCGIDTIEMNCVEKTHLSLLRAWNHNIEHSNHCPTHFYFHMSKKYWFVGLE